MPKSKLVHVIEQTIVRRVEFDPNDLASAAAIQLRLQDTAKKMDGFISATTRMTKADPAAMPATPTADPLDIPQHMKR